MRYKGIIDKIFYTKAGNPWSSIRVGIYGKNNQIEEYINACGTIDNPILGFEIEFEGTEILDPEYGRQIKVDKSKIIRSSTEHGILAFLSSNLIKGIGSSTAQRIYDSFGKNSLKVIENHPEKLLEIKGIKEKTLEKITESYKDSVGYFKIYDALGGKITPKQAKKLVDKYGDNAAKIVKKNPYRIIYELDGFGFLKADEIAKAAGIPRDSIARVGAAMIYILKCKSETDGHCYVNSEDLQLEGIRLLAPIPKVTEDGRIKTTFERTMESVADRWNIEKDNIIDRFKVSKPNADILDAWIENREHFIDKMAEALYEEIKEGRIVYEEESDAIYWSAMYKAEKACARDIAYMLNERPVWNVADYQIDAAIKNTEFESGYALGDEQKEAIRKCLNSRLSIITGGPGRGKTTIIKTIIDAWRDSKNVVLCAPTGRAAQRMKEATGHDASTLQSLSGQKLSKKLVIIDESSMIDVRLGADAFELAKECNMIFVGDVDQLPSIGPGNFFADMIKSKIIPTTVLKTGYRNEGSISINAERVNNGKTVKDMKQDEHFIIKSATKETIVNEIIKLYDEWLKTYDLKDVCVICPMRRRSQTGTEQLNKILRDHINPYKKGMPKIDKVDFRPGDRVMETQNNKKKEVIKNHRPEVGVFNGDCGIILGIDPDANEVIIQFDDGRVGVFDPLEMQDFVLAYAITIHKSQGSEYKALAVAMNKEHYVMLQRNLLYTAITRGKENVYFLGDKEAFNMAVRNTDYKLRNSKLRYRILEEQKRIKKYT